MSDHLTSLGEALRDNTATGDIDTVQVSITDQVQYYISRRDSTCLVLVSIYYLAYLVEAWHSYPIQFQTQHGQVPRARPARLTLTGRRARRTVTLFDYIPVFQMLSRGAGRVRGLD